LSIIFGILTYASFYFIVLIVVLEILVSDKH